MISPSDFMEEQMLVDNNAIKVEPVLDPIVEPEPIFDTEPIINPEPQQSVKQPPAKLKPKNGKVLKVNFRFNKKKKLKEVNFPCDICDFTTTKSGLLRGHVTRMHKTRVECSQCDHTGTEAEVGLTESDI